MSESESKNSNLSRAKNAKNDEFYTQYNDIEKEMQAYLYNTPRKLDQKIAANKIE